MKIFLCALLLAAVTPPVKAVDHHSPLPNLRGVASVALSDGGGPGNSAPLCKHTGQPCDKSATSGTMSCCGNWSCLPSTKFGNSGLGECGTDTTSRTASSHTCRAEKEQCSISPASLDQQCCGNLICQPFPGSRGGSSLYGMCTMPPPCRSENELCSTSTSAPPSHKCCGNLSCQHHIGTRGGSLGFDGQCKPSTPASTRLSTWGESEFVANNNEDEEEEGWIEDDDYQEPGDGEDTEDGAIKNE
jgi:hypothetical protein